jgi:putative membrane-bound dehydrogenase-like protein
MSSLLPWLLLFTLAATPTDAPLPPREAPLRMTVPDGFKVTLFAGEPDVVQPIAFTFDDRGRLWVAECYSYPKWQTPSHQPGEGGKDRVLIFEDTDGDGSFDKRTVFADKLSNLSGIEYGFGGIWLCSLPHLIFIPIEEGKDRPAGPPEIKLDGWDMKSGHNVFNSLKWGPDGWLYGCNGILATSKVGPPGTTEKERVPINCGVWRYHPTKKKFEAYAHGTTNPWGLDWNDHGEMFITNCVIAHLWHVVPGAHFERMFGQDLNPNVYGLLKSCADHIHWAGGSWTSSRGGQGAHSDAGGGHAHVGCMVYLGDNWPESYRNGVFMCNLHGNRINHDILERNGSSYVACHGKDFLFANDPWFRGLALNYGPDGGVYVSDWTDTGECHNYKVAHTGTGRIYKIVYGKPEHKKIDLAKLSDEDLVRFQFHANDWFVRHARRLLQERAWQGKLAPGTKPLLWKHFTAFQGNLAGKTPQRLRALWALHAIEGLPQNYHEVLLSDLAESVRAWGVRLLLEEYRSGTTEQSRKNTLRDTLAHHARDESSPRVRLALASALQYLAVADRYRLALNLLRSHDDSQDPYLPWMLWYGLEPLVTANPDQMEYILFTCKIPLVRELMVRRFASAGDANLNGIVQTFEKKEVPTWQRDVLRGLQEALAGRRSVPMPPGWEKAYPLLVESPLPEVRQRTLALAVQFGDERALTTLRKILVNEKSAASLRQNALQTLLLKQPPDLVSTLQELLKDAALRGPVLRGLAAYADAKTPGLILDQYASFNDEEKTDALQTLSSRVPYALALLAALEKKQVPPSDLSHFTVRQLQALGHKDITARLNQVWGTLRPASEEKTKLLAKYTQLLSADFLKKASKSNGRAIYAKTCAACHRLFDEGGAIGPDITGSQRGNLDYILENILDPSAIVQREFQVAILTTTGGRTLTGILKQETDRAVTMQTPNEVIIMPKEEIDMLTRTKTSMMPDGLLDNLRPEEVRDLIAYLASPVQVSLVTGTKK